MGRLQGTDPRDGREQERRFFHNGAKALTETLPTAQYRSLEGRDHSAILMAPKAMANAVQEFFLARK